jgi:hypothetical protein
MAVCLLPGTALAVVPDNIVVSPATQTVVQGATIYVSAELWNAGVDQNVDVTGTPTIWSITDPLGSCDVTDTLVSGYETCVANTVGTWTIYAQQGSYTPGSATVVVTSAGVQYFSVYPSAFYNIPPDYGYGTLLDPGPWDETVGVADTVTVCAIDINGATLTSYTGTIRFSSSDLLATLPANYTYVAGDLGCHTFSVTFGNVHYQSLFVNDISDISMYGYAGFIVGYPDAYKYEPLDTPVRLLDTRTGNGFSGKLSAGTPAGIPIANRGGVPWCATAVTGNLTVTNPTAGWAVYLGPTAMAAPTSSTINFVKGQTVANSLTVELNSTTGYLWATYISTAGNTTDLVFDVTGYYGCFTDLTYFPMAMPARVLDTRANNGYAGKLTANMPVTFPVAGVAGVPLGADAVTGNLTVTDASSGWAVYLGATPQANPSSSTINFAGGSTVANGVTVGLSGGGNLSATFISTPGQTADLVFDVTGYYTDSSRGEYYVPIAPVRILDSRVTGPLLYANFPQAIQVTGMQGIPTWGVGAVTGNLTVTDETNGWAMYAGPTPQVNPATSNINFVTGQIVANGMTSGLHGADPWPAGEVGYLNVTYISTAGNTTNAVFDATGYFINESIIPI